MKHFFESWIVKWKLVEWFTWSEDFLPRFNVVARCSGNACNLFPLLIILGYLLMFAPLSHQHYSNFCLFYQWKHSVRKSRLTAAITKSVYNSLWLIWRGVWRAVLLRSRARGASSSGAKSVYPDPKARSSPRRKSLRGTFARLSLRKHKRRRQVLANSRLRSWTNLWLVPVCYLFPFRACTLDRGELNRALDWFDGVSTLLFAFRLRSTNQPLVLIWDSIEYLDLTWLV